MTRFGHRYGETNEEHDNAMADLIFWNVIFLGALYLLYHADPEHKGGKYKSFFSFYRALLNYPGAFDHRE